jgi:HD-GYP domain-containing protein (c-di-GMP phosphodiesterase class II)
VSAVNDGRIFRFVPKPCDSEELKKVIEAGIEHHQALVAERELLEQTLSGSIKMLVEIVAMSRPLAHLRASVIQRWARKVHKALGSKPSLEQGISAMLCTLGYLTLPDSLADRYLNGESLTPDEKRAVNEAASQARDLVLNIPRMEGIADAIYYCRKGYDGSGFPEDEMAGENLPEAARILCALIDLAEVSAVPSPSFDACMAELEQNRPRYDPAILQAMHQALGGDQLFAGNAEAEKVNASVRELIAGDTLATDIRDGEGRLLLAAGSPLSAVTIKRLRSVESLDAGDVRIAVWRQNAAAARSEGEQVTIS